MNSLNRITIFSLLVFFLISCQKGFFDQVPDDRMTIDEVFQRRQQSEEYLANVYKYIQDEMVQTANDEAPWFGASDEGDVTYTSTFTNAMNLGNWNSSSDYYEYWSHYYAGIRSATYFIQRIDENVEILNLANGQVLIDQYKAEARALRAMFYSALVKQYGPVIILPSEAVIEPDAEASEFLLPRNTYDECIDFITNEFDLAADALPEWYNNPADYGRITKAACLAYKSRLLLYAASPLWNGNTDLADFRNQDGTQLVNQVYQEQKWKRAAEAAKAVIELNRFSLYRENNSNGEFDPFLSFQNAFLTPWNSEVIFARKHDNSNMVKRWEWRCTPRFAGGTAANNPTQQIVDAFQMENGEIPIIGYNSDGSPIINSESGYVETGFSNANTKYTETGTWNMYVNREPRFYVSIAYNGGKWVNATAFPQKIGLYFTGNTGKSGAGREFSRTGYLVRKDIHPNSNYQVSTGGIINRPVVLMRLAEIYLNYAEALNEYDPGNPDVSKYINFIRQRAGIPDLMPMNKEQIRERIHLERRIELAFERHRYFDARRWKIAEHTDGGDFFGMDVDSGTSLTDATFFKRTVFEKRVFEAPRHYLFPIPMSEIERNPNLVQNVGW